MKEVLAVIVILAVLALGVSCEVARWRECRRVHPWWYCAAPNH